MSSSNHDESLPFPREVIEAYASGELQDPSLARRIEADEDVMQEVQRIQDENDFLTKLAGAWSTMPGAARSGPPRQEIEGYRIISEVFRGGQGIVYKALQEHTKRIVAIKVMLGGALATERARQRFEREVELVASLRHQNIVTVYDSGTILDGGHYLVMEFIRGVPLSRAHVFGRELLPEAHEESVRVRLGQFISICEAIQYAHQRGIIHRDLKPGNILIDRNGTPKVFDFGVAKVIGPTSSNAATLTGEFVGTFAYASPEQVKGDSEGVDTRSDLYALGLILYEFLTEQHPYSVRGSVSEVVENILTAEPVPMRKHDPLLKRDLEAIVQKSLEKDPDARYQSAAAMAQDLENYLAGDPVEALRDNASYLLSKVVRKYRVPFLVGTAVVFALAIITVFMSVLWYRATKAEQIAEDRLLKVERESLMRGEVTEMFTDIIESLQPEHGLGTELTVSEMIDQAARLADQRSGVEPEVHAAMLEAIGNTYLALGNLPEAKKHLIESLNLRVEALGPSSQPVGDCHYELGYLHLVEGDLEKARESFDKSMVIRNSTDKGSISDRAAPLHALGLVAERAGDLEEANAYFSESLQMRQNASAPDLQEVTQSKISKARILRKLRQMDEAELLYEEALDELRADGQTSSPMIATILNNLAVVQGGKQNWDTAIELYRESLEQRRRFYPPSHHEIGHTLFNMAHILRSQERFLEAEPLLLEALTIYIDRFGNEHQMVANISGMYGFVLLNLEQFEESLAAYERSLGICQRTFGNDDWRTASQEIGIGFVLLSLERFDEAEQYLLNGYRTNKQHFGDTNNNTIRAMEGLNLLYEAKGDTSQAELWSQRIELAKETEETGE